jgi:ribosomal protein S27E
MTTEIIYGHTEKEKEYAKARMPKTDITYRRENRKIYPCANCSEPLTVYEHMKFLFMCMRCAQGGAAHYEQWGQKVYLTNRGH